MEEMRYFCSERKRNLEGKTAVPVGKAGGVLWEGVEVARGAVGSGLAAGWVGARKLVERVTSLFSL